MAMEFDRKYAVQSNILQIEESFRDAIIKAHEERYRKLRDEMSKLMSETMKTEGAPIPPPMPAFSVAPPQEVMP